MARDYGMNRQGLYPQEESRAGTIPFYRRGMMAKGGTVRMKKGGSAIVDTYDYGGTVSGRRNLLEEEGRLDAERMNPNRRAEKRRVIGELNRDA
tara:strand:- start:550 stop:831 length:282 start_codon:yes stop_codon:yes gene_type:complete